MPKLHGDPQRPGGLFVTIEGTDFSGKSTLVANLRDELGRAGGERTTHFTREPGGTPAAERIREVVLDPSLDMDDWTEAYLYAAARLDHARGEILPRLLRGENVVCERYVDSSVAYQGAGRGIGVEAVRELNERALGIASPDRTFYLRLDSGERRRRAEKRKNLDRLEKAGDGFMAKVSLALDEIAASEPERVTVLDASLHPKELSSTVARYILGGEYTS